MKDRELIEITAEIIRFTFQSENFCVCFCKLTEPNSDIVVNPTFGTFTLTGNIKMLNVGTKYRFVVTPTTHPKYGTQYQLVRIPMFEKLEDLTPEENFQLLCEITTETQAKYIQKAYPNFIELILTERDDEIDLKKIYNVGEVYFKTYKERIFKHFTYFLINKEYPEYKLSQEEVEGLYKKYDHKEGILNALRTNPYQVLIQILDKPFPSVDRIVITHHKEFKESVERLEALLLYLLKTNEDTGSTRIDANRLASFINKYEPKLWGKVKEVVLNSPKIYYDTETKYASIWRTWKTELNLSQWIKDGINSTFDWGDIDYKEFSENEYFNLTEQQEQLLEYALKYNMVLLTGYAGSGKTASIKALIHMLDALQKHYVLLAPTGIAAKRLSESTGREASTIHRMYGSTIFEEYAPPESVIIIDEVSMLSLEHYNMIMHMFDSTQHKIILIGDIAQLPSIGCGNVLNDILKWGQIPRVNLDKIFRYGKGGIATVSTDTRNERPFLDEYGNCIYEGVDEDTQYVFHRLEADALEQIFNIYQQLRNTYKKEDIIILSPFNVGDMGTYAINMKIQQHYNAGKEHISTKKTLSDNSKVEICFAAGDRVLYTKNKQNIKVYNDNLIGDEEPQVTSLCNGELGIVRQVFKADPQEHTLDTLIVEFDNELVRLSGEDLEPLLLGYALSVHKVQGSQAKAVLIVTAKEHGRMLSNNLLYVALTRAQEQIIHIGHVSTINQKLHVHEAVDRDTWLLGMLNQED